MPRNALLAGAEKSMATSGARRRRVRAVVARRGPTCRHVSSRRSAVVPRIASRKGFGKSPTTRRIGAAAFGGDDICTAPISTRARRSKPRFASASAAPVRERAAQIVEQVGHAAAAGAECLAQRIQRRLAHHMKRLEPARRVRPRAGRRGGRRSPHPGKNRWPPPIVASCRACVLQSCVRSSRRRGARRVRAEHVGHRRPQGHRTRRSGSRAAPGAV